MLRTQRPRTGVKTFLSVTSISTCILLVMMASNWSYMSYPVVLQRMQGHIETMASRLGFRSDLDLSPQSDCAPVLDRGIIGRWVPRPADQEEVDMWNKFLKLYWISHNLPPTLQREDGRCGDVSLLEGGKGNKYMRAMCDPGSKTSCCYSNHTCVALAAANCTCDGCVDIRQSLIPEMATWIPQDTTCKMGVFKTSAAVCPLFPNGSTIHVLGDSFLREVSYTLINSIVASDVSEHDIDFKDSGNGIQSICNDEFYRHIRVCSGIKTNTIKLLDSNKVIACDGQIRLLYNAKWEAVKHAKDIAKIYEGYVNQSNTFVILGMGIHNDYNAERVISTVLDPLLKLRQVSDGWPYFVWVAPHSPGLLKNPSVKSQGREKTMMFNSKVNPFLRARGVAVVDGFSITKENIMSPDGTHYGKAVNELKTQLFLNHISEGRQQGLFKKKSGVTHMQQGRETT